MLFYQLKRFLSRSDVQQNPLKALFKRFSWRLRWLITDRPYIIPFVNNLKISIPKSGSGACIYYRGLSEPETADFILRFLRPGMVLIDVGAHLGEYTLLAAQAVESTGEVHAFEPQVNLFAILSQNVQMNDFNNVILNRSAVSDRPGEIEFEVNDEPSVSSIRKHDAPSKHVKVVKVSCTSLDTYWSNQERKIDLIKVDVEGAEKFVFEGAKQLLGLSPDEAPTWIFEYSLTGYAGFDYHPSELVELLSNYGYEVWRYSSAGKLSNFDPKSSSELVNLIATKNKSYLQSQLTGITNIATDKYVPI
jgi:FkbM family methyltransferase